MERNGRWKQIINPLATNTHHQMRHSAKWFNNTKLHVDILISWLIFHFILCSPNNDSNVPASSENVLYYCVCACMRVTGGGWWGIAGRIAVQAIVSKVCVSALWLNRVYQAGAMAIVVQHHCCSISHSPLNNGIFPLRFAIAVAGANLNLIHPPDSPWMQKPF